MSIESVMPSNHLILCHPLLLPPSTFLSIRVFSFFSFIFISWRLITLQYCSGFCYTLTWISHGFTCVPHPDPLSHLRPHPIPLGLSNAPALSTCLMHPTWTGDLFHIWQYNCFNAILSEHRLLPQSPKVCSIHLLFFPPSLIMPLMSGRKAISFSIISPLCLLLLLLPPPFLPSIPPSLSLTPKHTHIYGCLEESDVKISCQIFSKLPTDVWLGCTGAFTEKCHLSLYASEQKHGLNFTKVEKWCSVLFCVL